MLGTNFIFKPNYIIIAFFVTVLLIYLLLRIYKLFILIRKY